MHHREPKESIAGHCETSQRWEHERVNEGSRAYQYARGIPLGNRVHGIAYLCRMLVSMRENRQLRQSKERLFFRAKQSRSGPRLLDGWLYKSVEYA